MAQMSSPPGANATIQTDILEKYVYGLINFGQIHENDKSVNPNELNQISWTATGDDSTFRADLRLPYDMVKGSIKGHNYLPHVSFTSDRGGFDGANWVEELILAVIEQKNLELSDSSNQKKQDRVSWSSEGRKTLGATAVFIASVTIKIISVLQADASTKTEAEEYLN